MRVQPAEAALHFRGGGAQAAEGTRDEVVWVRDDGWCCGGSALESLAQILKPRVRGRKVRDRCLVLVSAP